jgi:hypothetical protein
MSDGGTNMYCHRCSEIKSCEVIGLSTFGTENSFFGDYEIEQRRSIEKYPDLQFFMRGRQCQTCGNKFITVEIREDAINELVELRDKLVSIKDKANSFNEKASALEHSANFSDFLYEMETLSMSWED